MHKSLLAFLLLTSCASYDAARTCQNQAGPRPYAAAEFLSPVAVLAVGQTDERQAYYKSVDDCMDAWRVKQAAQSDDAAKSDKNSEASASPAAPM